MRGWKVDPNTNALVVESTGLVPISGIEAAAQEARIRLRFFKGEYFLDVRQGVPYFQTLLRKGVDVERVREIVRQTVLSVEGISDVPRVTINVDRATRRATIQFAYRYLDGRTGSEELLIEV